MEINVVELLEQFGPDMGVTFHKDYSGRGMYGRTCVALIASQCEVDGVISAVICDMVAGLVDQPKEAKFDYSLAVQDAVDKLLTEQRRDNMGLDVVVYWPSLCGE